MSLFVGWRSREKGYYQASVGKCAENPECTHPAFKKVNGTPTLENYWADLHMMKPGVSTQPSNSIPRYSLKKNKTIPPNKNVYVNVQDSNTHIHYSSEPKGGTTQMFISQETKQQCYICKTGYDSSPKQDLSAWYSMEMLWGCYAYGEKLVTKYHKL